MLERLDAGPAASLHTVDPVPDAIVCSAAPAGLQDSSVPEPHSRGLRSPAPDFHTHGLNSHGLRALAPEFPACGLGSNGVDSRVASAPDLPSPEVQCQRPEPSGGSWGYVEPPVVNSRRKGKCSAYTAPSTPAPAEEEPTLDYIQPSRVQYSCSYPGTPTYSPRHNTRRVLINAQSAKTEVARGGTSRRERLRPYTLEPPPLAQRFPKTAICSPAHAAGYSARARLLGSTSECCDFFPWKGNHKEDRVTETQARNGLYDKLLVAKQNLACAGSPPSQSELVLNALKTEQASARPSLAPYFQQRSGLQALSDLYLTIMLKRQMYSTVVVPSTFKPPPRVTLPENKRQAWLRDLANPAIPLRKLSRTIPHGLKGPSLLEQCSSKQIPTSRAVWFVRCVGANELRGLKRKGVGSLAVGGEAKWIREWTVQVTQFLEKAVESCDVIADGDWRSRMVYTYVFPAFDGFFSSRFDSPLLTRSAAYVLSFTFTRNFYSTGPSFWSGSSLSLLRVRWMYCLWLSL